MQFQVGQAIEKFFDDITFENDHSDPGPRPMFFGRGQKLFKLKECYQAFVAGHQVNYVLYNYACEAYWFYNGDKKTTKISEGLKDNELIEFQLDRIVFERVIA